MRFRALFALAASGPVSLAAGGCLVVSGSTSCESGVLVSQETIGQIEPGRTTEEWLVATLGEPTRSRSVDGQEGVRILQYEYEKREASGGAVFLIFAGGKEHVTRSVAYFEVSGGIVTRSWVEG